MENITLSTAELEMIQIKRQKEALEQQEREAKLKLSIEKDIAEKTQRAEAYKAQWLQQNAAARDYLLKLQELDVRFQIKENKKSETFKAWHYAKNETTGKDEQIIDAEIVAEAIELQIIHTEVAKTIVVEKHYTSSPSSFRSSKTDNGYKMKLYHDKDNRFTKDPKNMASKFTDILNQRQREIVAKSKAETTQQMAHAKLQELYPTAIIEHKSELRYYSTRPGRSSSYTETEFRVVFPNGYGIKVSYGVSGNNELWLRKDSTIVPIYKNEDNQLLKAENEAVHNFIAALQNIADSAYDTTK